MKRLTCKGNKRIFSSGISLKECMVMIVYEVNIAWRDVSDGQTTPILISKKTIKAQRRDSSIINCKTASYEDELQILNYGKFKD